MFETSKKLIKYKLMSMIKDKLIRYTSEMEKYYDMKQYDENHIECLSKCLTEEQFEKQRLERIKWSHDQWKMYYHKHQEASDILNLIEMNFNND
jgi:hypothetical protein